MATMKIIEIKGKLELLTGLHIGAGSDEIHIGGIDSPVVKDSYGNPYIPGSSLKGKIRSLLELSEGSTSGKPSSRKDYPNSLIPVVFGDLTQSEMTRLLVRDSCLAEESKDRLKTDNILPTEEKSENSINRLKGVAESPRKIERAIPGLLFDFEMVLRILSSDNEEKMKALLKKGLFLLEKDALGGSGSRGYGKIRFADLTYDGVPFIQE
jgi:CRISPR-associated protein Csm3